MTPRFPIALLGSVIALSCAPVLANVGEVPNTFTTGTPALAEEVNENFSALASQIREVADAASQVHQSYDAHLYENSNGDGVTCATKVFDYWSNLQPTWKTMTRNYARSGDTLVVTRTITDSAGQAVSKEKLTYNDTPAGLTLDKTEILDPASDMPMIIYAMANPQPERPADMRVGASWGSASVTKTFYGNDPEHPQTSTAITIGTLLSGPDGDGCLQIAQNRSGDVMEVGWYCEGKGLVKMIRTGRDLVDDGVYDPKGLREIWSLRPDPEGCIAP